VGRWQLLNPSVGTMPFAYNERCCLATSGPRYRVLDLSISCLLDPEAGRNASSGGGSPSACTKAASASSCSWAGCARLSVHCWGNLRPCPRPCFFPLPRNSRAVSLVLFSRPINLCAPSATLLPCPSNRFRYLSLPAPCLLLIRCALVVTLRE